MVFIKYEGTPGVSRGYSGPLKERGTLSMWCNSPGTQGEPLGSFTAYCVTYSRLWLKSSELCSASVSIRSLWDQRCSHYHDQPPPVVRCAGCSHHRLSKGLSLDMLFWLHLLVVALHLVVGLSAFLQTGYHVIFTSAITLQSRMDT